MMVNLHHKIYFDVTVCDINQTIVKNLSFVLDHKRLITINNQRVLEYFKRSE